MKIISWNCNGAFRKKFKHLLDFNADILVIQECENPSKTDHDEYKQWAENYLWIGDNKNKGLGIFAQKSITLDKLNWPTKFKDHDVKYFLPCRVNDNFDLLAVWAHRNDSPTFGYIGQIWKYLQINKSRFKRLLIAGDFNSNAIWDAWDRWWNHSDVVNELTDIGIESFYHKFTEEQQGKETMPTLYFRRNIEKPYHIDYIFGDSDFYDGLIDFQIGQPDKWLEISDHMPIKCELNVK